MSINCVEICRSSFYPVLRFRSVFQNNLLGTRNPGIMACYEIGNNTPNDKKRIESN